MTSYLYKLPKRVEERDEDETDFMDENLEFQLDEHITDSILTGEWNREHFLIYISAF